MRVDEVAEDQAPADGRRVLQRRLRLRDQRAHRRRPAEVDGDDARVGRLQRRREEEARSVVADVAPLRVVLPKQLVHRALRIAQIDVAEAVVDRVVARDGQHDVAPVVGHVRPVEPVAMLGPIVEDRVRGLRRAEPVLVDRVAGERAFERVTRLRLGIPFVQKRRVAGKPRHARKLAPLQRVGKVVSGRDRADVPRLPVGTGALRRVGEQLRIPARREVGDRRGAVLRHHVGIDQHARRAVQALHRVEHPLVLQAGRVQVEVLVAHVKGHAEVFVVEQRAQMALDRGALRDRVEIGAREPGLVLDPALRRRRVGALERPVRIGHRRTVVAVDGSVARWCRVVQRGLRAAHRRGQHERREQRRCGTRCGRHSASAVATMRSCSTACWPA